MRTKLAVWAVAGALPLAACADLGQHEADEAVSSDDALSTEDLRWRWARYVRTSVAPRLARLPDGARPDEEYVKRAVEWAIGEGVFTVSLREDYGQPNGRQSPLSYSNCLDRPSINQRTAYPDCPSVASGAWQVGVVGVQVGEMLPRLPSLYRTLYGEMPPRDLARLVLPWLGEDQYAFPDLSIDALADRRNARWASVILRDPAINVLALTGHPWIRNGIPSSYRLYRRRDIVDAVWREPVPSSWHFAETDRWVVGGIARAWFLGPTPFAAPDRPLFVCTEAATEPCLAAFGLPLDPMTATTDETDGAFARTQRFERAVFDWTRDASGERVTGRRLGADATGATPIASFDAIDGAFRAYYASWGGLEVFGWPLGPSRREGDLRVQDFERARLSRPAQGTFDANATHPVWQVDRAHLGR